MTNQVKCYKRKECHTRGNDGNGGLLRPCAQEISPIGGYRDQDLPGEEPPRGSLDVAWGGEWGSRAQEEGTAPAKATKQHQAWALYQVLRRA